jgi:exo-1,4-beta-D-glucosaminidase
LIEEKILDIEKRSSVRIGKIPEFNEISETYFLSIGIMDENNRQVASNLYWLSTKDDILDYEADIGSWAFYTPSKAFADFQQLALLPETDIAYELDAGFERNQTRIEVNLNNIGDKLAFFLEIKLVDAFEPRRRVPAFWSDNFISLGPHESRSINAVIPETGSKYGLEIQGWNIKDKRYWKL